MMFKNVCPVNEYGEHCNCWHLSEGPCCFCNGAPVDKSGEGLDDILKPLGPKGLTREESCAWLIVTRERILAAVERAYCAAKGMVKS